MKKFSDYLAPAVETVEVAMENGIAASGVVSPSAGRTGEVSYDSVNDNYEI